MEENKNDVFRPCDLEGFNYADNLGDPGKFPYTRGIHPHMYLEKPWTMRQFAGFGTPEDTNQRFHYLRRQGQNDLSVAFDLPTLMGLDSDHPEAPGGVGKEGVAIDTIHDVDRLFAGIPLDQVSVSMTINAPASMIWGMFLAVAKQRQIPFEKLRGTIQNDILKEYIAQKEFIVPPHAGLKLVVDTIEYGTMHVPQWNTVSISGYHIREQGATAAQELAFTLADGIHYVEAAMKRGLDVDSFAQRLSFFFDVHNDFFEEIAKIRAARRMWSRIMRDRFGARELRSCLLRTHAQTAGVTLTAQQPENNIARVAIQALAGVLAGVQSLHTNSKDEVYALPTEDAVRTALRTQQIILEETGVKNIVDPLGGSYYVEFLTNRIEREANDYIATIDGLGGMVRAIELLYPQREIEKSADAFEKAKAKGEINIVGVNKYRQEEHGTIETLNIDEEKNRKEQIEKLQYIKQTRDNYRVQTILAAIRVAARSEQNLMPHFIEAAEHLVTLGEMTRALQEVYGEYREAPVF